MAQGKLIAGAIGGLLSGLVAALSFYVLAPIGGYSMMLVSWLLLWILLAALQTYLDGQLNVARAVGRGLVTAVVAGLGFAVVLFELYRSWPPPAFSVFKHFVAWSLAYLPGFGRSCGGSSVGSRLRRSWPRPLPRPQWARAFGARGRGPAALVGLARLRALDGLGCFAASCASDVASIS